jgi:hypothetical protein
VDQAADVAVSEAGRCELPTGDGVEEREVGWIVRAQGAEAAAVLDDGATDGIEELRAGGLVFDRGQFLPEERCRCREARMQRFTELKVWQRAHALVLEIYRISTSFPPEERFGVTSQLRRVITSVPTNIAEGSRRQGQQETLDS